MEDKVYMRWLCRVRSCSVHASLSARQHEELCLDLGIFVPPGGPGRDEEDQDPLRREEAPGERGQQDRHPRRKA